MAPIWRWLLVALAAGTMCCLVPGSMVSQVPSAEAASIVTPVSVPPVSECAVVSCNRGSPPSVPLPAISMACVLTAGILVLALLWAGRRVRTGATHLPTGTPSRLLRPPQHLLPA
jgi:hypothetical protein